MASAATGLVCDRCEIQPIAPIRNVAGRPVCPVCSTDLHEPRGVVVVDAAFDPDSHLAALAAVIGDRPLVTSTIRAPHAFDAELEAIVLALETAESRGLGKLLLKSDCKGAVQAIHTPPSRRRRRWRHRAVYGAAVLERNPQWRLVWVRRPNVRAAHRVARGELNAAARREAGPHWDWGRDFQSQPSRRGENDA